MKEGRSLEEVLLGASKSFVGWSIEHPAYAQLLFWRPVPGFTPSAEAYAPAIETLELFRSRLAMLQQRGLLRADVDVADVQRDWTILLSGVISQQLSNAAGEPLAAGRFTAALPDLVAMFVRHYGTCTTPKSDPPKKEPAVSANIDQIADRIYRISTFVPDIGPTGFTFNQFLVDAEEPLLYHTGMRQLFPLVSEAIEQVLPVERLRWIAFSHLEADECGAVDEFLAAAPHARPL